MAASGPMNPRDDVVAMRRALDQAEQALGLSDPNPRVGCVLVNLLGEEIGKGHTQRTGGPHAEIMALRDAQSRGHPTSGSSAYVTLEPCAHFGRTGPCCEALIAAGVRRVVAAISDPNPQVGGRGFARLRAAGIEVEIGPGANESRELNIGFFSRMLRQTPWVRLKIAASLDGKIALNNGVSQWITSELARADGHAWRARAGAILTGIGTVRDDNPRLDVRLGDKQRDGQLQPAVVVVDSRLETPLDANLFIGERPVYIYAAERNPEKEAALTARRATVVYTPGTEGRVDLKAMLRDLARHQVNELHVEAGKNLNGALLREGLVDELLVYLAPKMLGQGHDMAMLGPLTALDKAVQLEFKSSASIGPDLRIVSRIAGRDRF